MPQFDSIFFSLIASLFFILFLFYFFVFFFALFLSFFQVNKFPKNFTHQDGLINTIETEIQIMKIMRISWIKKKILEFHDF